MKRIRRIAGTLVLGSMILPVSMVATGCSEGTEVQLQQAPPVDIPANQPVPPEPTKGGGAGSSGNMQFNPGASS
jgi:hypothetical protein